MNKKNILLKIWPIIRERKVLRTLSLLNLLFIFLITTFFFISSSHGKKIEDYQKEISQNDQLIISLQQLIVNKDGQEAVDLTLFSNKAFSGYDEVVPFIPYVENLLADVDQAAEVAIKSSEEQIFIDHFADYRVSLIVEDKETFFEAMDELHSSRFITKLLNFTMHYKPVDSKGKNEFSEAEFTLRLYLK